MSKRLTKTKGRNRRHKKETRRRKRIDTAELMDG